MYQNDLNAYSYQHKHHPSLFDKPMKDLVAERIQGKVGALIASGYQPDDVGNLLTKFTTLDVQEPLINEDKLLGTIVYIDHYGNAVTNISEKNANEFGAKPGDIIRLKIPGNTINVKIGTIYSDVPQGK